MNMQLKLRIAMTIMTLVVSWSIARTQVINVADHGILPGGDVSYKVNELIRSLEGKANVTLYFPEGRYEFFPENAVEKFRAVTNHDNSLKRMAFPLFNFKGLTLDGGGSTFVFHGRMSPVVIEGSEEITLKNFSIDWDTPFHHELKVIDSDQETNTFVAEISPLKHGFEVKNGNILFSHYNWKDPIGQNITFNPETEAPIWNTKEYSLRVRPETKVTKLSDSQARFQNASKSAPPVGSVIATYGVKPTNRLAQAIHISSSKDTYIENVTVYAAGGMALIAERAENVHLNGFIVTSTDERYFATRADATHFLGCKGLVLLENCLFEHMLDDGINVHGAYIKVEEYQGDRKFLCEISHFQQWGLIFAEPGDSLMITSRETVLPLYKTAVEDIKILNEQRMLITVTDVPEEMYEGPLSMENLTWYPDVIMRKNVIRKNRARSALISTKGSVLIEDNYFSSQMHGILIEGDNNSWYESGGVRDITIRNNTFDNIGYGNDIRYPLYISPLLRPEQFLGDEKYHHNIRFTNNRLRSFNGHVVFARSVKGLTISGNTIEFSADYPKGSEDPSIGLDYCEDVNISQNEFSGFDWPIRIERSECTSDVKVRKNKGVFEEFSSLK